MSKYTTELRYICESLNDFKSSQEYSDVDLIIENSREKIFSFDYPLFNRMYKPELEKKILRAFYTREIGYETYGLWKLKLQTKLEEIMPYYNKLYESELLKVEPFINFDMVTEHELNIDGKYDKNILSILKQTIDENTNNTTDATNSGTSIDKSDKTGKRTQNTSGKQSQDENNIDMFNDTPQGGLNTMDDYQGKWLSKAERHTKDIDNTNTQNTTDNNSENYKADQSFENSGQSTSDTDRNSLTNRDDNVTEKQDETKQQTYIEHKKGKNNYYSYSQLLTDYRNTFINIDKMIIDELEILFMGIW